MVGSVEYQVINDAGVRYSFSESPTRMTTKDRAEAEALKSLWEQRRLRVVAIVDPAQIVPLASGEPIGWRDDDRHGLHHKREMPAYLNPQTVTPLYPGIAQPAQERDG